MHYVIAIIGALFIYIAVFLLTCVLVAFLPPVFRPWVNLGIIQTNNPLGLLLAALAALHSFRSTMRYYKIKGETPEESIDKSA